jgi:simple sugar transport system ATP-binding protein
MYAGRIVGIVPAGTPRALLGLMMAGMSAPEAELAAQGDTGHLPAPGELEPGSTTRTGGDA